MSSFYGNIKFNNQTPLIFDKIYTSRSEMERKCNSDGIFNGRFVLISYGDVRYTPYHKVEPMNQNTFQAQINAGVVYYITDSTAADGFASTTEYKAGQDYYVRTEYSIDDTSTFAKNKSIDEKQYNHDYHNTVWQKIWTSTQNSDEVAEKYIMISHLDAETPKITMIVDAPNDIKEFDDSNKVYYLVPTNQGALNQSGYISEEDFNKHRNKLHVQDEDLDENGEVQYRLLEANEKWNIETIYYLKQDDVYNRFAGSTPYIDGMISEELYLDLINNRQIPLFTFNGTNYTPSFTKDEKTNVYTALTGNDGWLITNKYYFVRYSTVSGRPHFDPIMSTDLEYRLHVPRNWKWNNSVYFEYNKDGFKPEKANFKNGTNQIVLQNEKSEDIYPIHRPDIPDAAQYDADLNLIKTVQDDTKKFSFDLTELGDAVSKMWDAVYPRRNPEDNYSTRDTYIGNDRLRPDNDQENYPETLAEAVRKLYYWLGLKTDNNFKYGPWIDPNTGEEVDTIFGVLNAASDVLGDYDDRFDMNLFVPIKSPYYPDGYNKEGNLTQEEFALLHEGGAGPLYIKTAQGQYEHATTYNNNTQYYRNMNSLMSLLAVWNEIVKDHQADWTYDKGHIDWDEYNPLHPRFIRNKPLVLQVDQSNEPIEDSINWYWINYAL